jgi:hypothetical protein
MANHGLHSCLTPVQVQSEPAVKTLWSLVAQGSVIRRHKRVSVTQSNHTPASEALLTTQGASMLSTFTAAVRASCAGGVCDDRRSGERADRGAHSAPACHSTRCSLPLLHVLVQQVHPRRHQKGHRDAHRSSTARSPCSNLEAHPRCARWENAHITQTGQRPSIHSE